MEFTGERYLPEIEGNIYLEHYHRYYSITEIIRNKVVLDIACGEGYGTHIISEHCTQITGVDISQMAVDHAAKKYTAANIDFKQGSTDSIPLDDNSVDVVVSFETIEHHDRHEQMLLEIKRVLKPDGVLVISSPDRENYNKTLIEPNEHHVKELTLAEFKPLLNGHFKHTRFNYQKLVYGSLICSESDSSFEYVSNASDDVYDQLAPTYDIAVCSDRELDFQLTGFFDGTAFYEHEIAELRAQIERMSASRTWKTGRFFLSPLKLFKRR